MKTAILLSAALLAVPAFALAEGTAKILDCMRANIPPTLRVQQIEFVTTDRGGGSRTLKGRVYTLLEKTPSGGGLVRAMLRVEAPASYKGAAYLVRETKDFLNEGMYVYLPSVGRVRRVSGSFADSALLGTNFSYGDFRQIENAFVGSTARLEGTDRIEGRPVHVLLFQPAPDPRRPPSRYSRVRAWVDRQSCLPLKADFYEGAEVRKQLSASPAALKQSGKFWYVTELKMRDLLEGSQTVLRVVGVTAGHELPGSYFSPQLFYLAQ